MSVHVTVPAKARIPVLGFAGYSGAGKTTLLTRLLPVVTSYGLRVGVIKHTHHRFEIDQPGKDSHRLRSAGAQQILIASPTRRVLVTETRGRMRDPVLKELLPQFDQSSLDLILVEGFRHERFPKIEIHRPALNNPLLYENDDSVIALASDEPVALKRDIPSFDLNDIEGIAQFIRAMLPGAAMI